MEEKKMKQHRYRVLVRVEQELTVELLASSAEQATRDARYLYEQTQREGEVIRESSFDVTLRASLLKEPEEGAREWKSSE